METLEGNVCLPPVHAIPRGDSAKVRMSGKISVPVQSPRIGRITRSSDDNYSKFQWYQPGINLERDIEIFYSRTVVTRKTITFRFGNSYFDNVNYVTLSLGYAFERYFEITGIRFDIGLTALKHRSVRFVEPHGEHVYVCDPQSRKIIYDITYNTSYRFESIEIRGGVYASVKFGLHKKDTPWGIDIQSSMQWQRIAVPNPDFMSFDYYFPSSHVEGYAGVYFFSVTPFISYSFSSKSQIFGGVSMIRELDISDSREFLTYIHPFVQYDYSFDLYD